MPSLAVHKEVPSPTAATKAFPSLTAEGGRIGEGHVEAACSATALAEAVPSAAVPTALMSAPMSPQTSEVMSAPTSPQTFEVMSAPTSAQTSEVTFDVLVVGPFFRADAEVFAVLGGMVVEDPRGMGSSIPVDPTNRTDIPGAWAVGNVADKSAMLGASAASGVQTGAMINYELIQSSIIA